MQVFSTTQSCLISGSYTNRQLLNTVEGFTFQKFVELSSKFLKTGRSVWFFNGNMTSEKVKEIVLTTVETIGLKSIPKDELCQDRVISLPENSEISVEFNALKNEESNSAIVSFYQDSPKKNLMHGLLHEVVYQILGQPAFDFLRTKEQLGYIVFCRMFNYRGILGGGFIVQSSDRSCEFVILKIREFLDVYKEKFQNLTNEEFETAVNAVIMTKKEIDINLATETVRLFREIERHDYEFDVREKQIEGLAKMIDSTTPDYYED